MKIRSHLALMAAAVLLPVALFSGLALAQMLKAEREAVVLGISEAARSTSLAVDREWNYAEGVVRALSTSQALANEDFEGFYAQANIANGDKSIHTVLIEDTGQQRLNTAMPLGHVVAPPLPSAKNRVKNVLASQTAQISNFIIGRATGKPIVTIEFPVKVASGRRYVIGQWMYAEDLRRAFPSEGVPPSWLIGIFDREGVTIARNRGPDDFLGKPPKEDLLQAILEKKEGHIRNRSRDGLELYTVLARSPQSGWTVAVGVPAAEIEAAARKAVVLASFGLFGAIGLAISAALLFGRRLMRAINSTASAAVSLGQGKVPAVTFSHVEEVDNVHRALHDAGKVLRSTEHERNALLDVAREAQALAERQSQAKDNFLAMLGHELRNPLSAITAGVSLLERDDTSPEAVRRGREVIRRQTRLLTHIVDDLLDASRVMTGKIALSKKCIDLAEVATACLRALHARGVTAGYQVDSKVAPVFAIADPTRMSQVINNLLDNAFKYTPVGGRVSLEVCTEGDQAVIRVSDSGIGISAELLTQVFDVFVQAPVSLHRANGGLGIGLAVVRNMAEQHGGSVTVKSAGEGMGSCFEVRLPGAISESLSESSALAQPEPQRKSVKVLLIDDNDDARQTLAELLGLFGYEVIQARNGEEGVEMAVASVPDCAIVDIGLPGINGYEVVLRLRANLPTCGMRLIALTGYGQAADKQKALDVGFDQHLNKPVDIDTLVDAISTTGSRGDRYSLNCTFP